MPADIVTAMEAGEAASAQTSAAQHAIDALQSTTKQGIGELKDYTGQATGALKDYTGAANETLANYGNAAGNALTGYGTQAQAYYRPYIDFGTNATTKLNGLLGYGGGDPQASLESTPGYQFTLNQGLKAAQNNATSRGLGISGAALKGAASYATGLADQTYQSVVGNNLTAAQLGLQGASGAAQTTAGIGAGLGSIYSGIGAGISGNLLTAGTNSANYLYGTGSTIAGLYGTLGENVGNQYTNIGQAKANAAYATAQALQNTEAELISAAGSAYGGGKK